MKKHKTAKRVSVLLLERNQMTCQALLSPFEWRRVFARSHAAIMFSRLPFQTFLPLSSLQWQTAAAPPSTHFTHSSASSAHIIPPVHSSLSPSHYTLLLSHPSSPPVPWQRCHIFPRPWILHDCSSMHLEGRKKKEKKKVKPLSLFCAVTKSLLASSHQAPSPH